MTTLLSLAISRPRGGDPADDGNAPGEPRSASGALPRIDALVRSEFRFVWRLLRRLGLRDGDADDAAQQVFVIAARRLSDIQEGRERAFLYGTALHVASKAKRGMARRREELHAELEAPADGADRPDELVDQRRARALLDELLDKLPLELRAVLVLHEIDELSASEIAEVVGIPAGTAASRLRRAREAFERELKRVEARLRHAGGRERGDRR